MQIKLFFVDGGRLTTAEITNWTGAVALGSRTGRRQSIAGSETFGDWERRGVE